MPNNIPNVPMHFSRAFCFGFPVEKTSTTKSGWKPIYGDKQPLFADLRITGWAAALQTGQVDILHPLGYFEDRYPEEKILRPEVQKLILVNDYGVDPAMVEPMQTEANTWDHLVVMKQVMKEQRIGPRECVIITNHYHDVRSSLFALMADLPGIWVFPAEAFLLEAGVRSRDDLVREFGGGDYAKTVVAEIGGIADILGGRYQIKPSGTPESAKIIAA